MSGTTTASHPGPSGRPGLAAWGHDVSRETRIGIGVAALAVAGMAVDHLLDADGGMAADPGGFALTVVVSLALSAFVFGRVKGSTQTEILNASRAAASGEAVFGPVIASRLKAYFSGPGPPAAAFPELTPREREVLELVALGEGNDAIARRLRLSGKTVRNHVSNIFNKLQVVDRAQAIVKAREAGVGVKPPAPP